MTTLFNDFLSEETGAVTVDWVVLTAAIVGLGILVVAPIATGTNNMADKAGAAISSATVSLSSGLTVN